jgi:hypothetical protein
VKIQLDTDTSDCPGAVCKIWRDRPDQASDECLIQSDWDAPGIASTFGWSLSSVGSTGCEHRGTDGTVDCPECGEKSSAFIAAAIDYINDHDGDEVEDPGYFEET